MQKAPAPCFCSAQEVWLKGLFWEFVFTPGTRRRKVGVFPYNVFGKKVRRRPAARRMPTGGEAGYRVLRGFLRRARLRPRRRRSRKLGSGEAPFSPGA